MAQDKKVKQLETQNQTFLDDLQKVGSVISRMQDEIEAKQKMLDQQQ
jgi:hypothetical protein